MILEIASDLKPERAVRKRFYRMLSCARFSCRSIIQGRVYVEISRKFEDGPWVGAT